MKKHRYTFSFFVTALIYAGFLLLYLFLVNSYITFTSDAPKEETIELALSQFVPQAPPSATTAPVQQEQLVEEEPAPEPETSEEPELEEPVIEEQVPEPVVKEKPTPKPAVKKEKPKPKRHILKRKQTKKRTVKRKKPRKKRQISGGGSPHYSAAQRNAFLARIRDKIDRAKSYPRIAQRRGMQGTVKVRFTILKNGHVANISLSGPKIFYASVRKAVKSAFPVDVKKATISLPTTINLSLCYRLR